MRPNLSILVLAFLIFGMGAAAADDDVYVACHEGTALASADVRDVFLGEKQFLDGMKLVPVDNVAAQPAFLEKVLKMNATKYATTWAKKSFRDGVNPPAAMANDAAVIEFMRRTPGSCGYLAMAPPASLSLIDKY